MESIQVRLTYHPDYLSGQMEMEVRRVDCPDDPEEAENGLYDEVEGGEIMTTELPVAASLSEADIDAGKQAAALELQHIGLMLWDNDWLREGEYAVYNSVTPLDEPATRTYDIFDGIGHENFTPYELCNEAAYAYNMSQSAAHAAIFVLLQRFVAADPELVLDRRAVRDETAPPHIDTGIDTGYWLTVSEETARRIREALAARYEN
ncbi:hypothetical protein K388_07167 [Streptomyces sp. KhCrAH-43]|uniref:hypothetical protein n=1 Tax=unclassified Streptomyces TaxID=2593676 RepID=UPI0003754062|nr:MULTISPECIES: hypothetical protein [unclassified Streptomyces]MYS36369.1 hypothetical protein [Streptomyces sp. SID4920]MYX63932.1 hypothetical protein [Streptomyces sp. SID8373]RAJ47786.1 hypothetical protein K388_07167 [Streptomyces sp. KhCrAH-43]